MGIPLIVCSIVALLILLQILQNRARIWAWLHAPQGLEAWVIYTRNHHFTGGVVIGVSYFTLLVCMIPGVALTLVAGFMWGPLGGWIVIWPAAVASAATAFCLGRSVLRARVAAYVSKRPIFAAIDTAIAKRGAVLVWIVRASPILPNGPLNYALASTRVPFIHFFLATSVCYAPAILLCTYLGSTVSEFRDLGSVSASNTPHSTSVRVFYWFGLVATIFAVSWVSWTARREMKALQELAQPELDP